MSKKTFYITTPIYYPNGVPHMGHAYTTILCDVIARHNRIIRGDESVYFLTGTDENTSKLIQAAKKAQVTPEKFVADIVHHFKEFYTQLGVSNNQFIRTSDQAVHWPGVQKIWSQLEKSGDIEMRKYTGLYCVGCEAFKTEKELVDGKCPDHNEKPTVLQEENYFFKLSKYTNVIRQKIQSGEIEIMPAARQGEMLSLLDEGLQDISFSRPQKEIPWGIPVPNDPTQTVYVWCDALTNYVTALGYGRDDALYNRFWMGDSETVHVMGKDILRFHALIWPAMLLSAGLPLPKKILVHGMLISDGKKMSKTLGNVLDPQKFVDEYGADALRYYLMREVSPFEDGDITEEKFKTAYNAHLANGLGNLVSRIMKMAEDTLSGPASVQYTPDQFPVEYITALSDFNVKKAIDVVWESIGNLDKRIQIEQPFTVKKTDPARASALIASYIQPLYEIAILLRPFLPETSAKIEQAIIDNQKPAQPLFARK